MMKSNRGVALATLVVAVLIMLTITGTIAYTSLDTMKLRQLDYMYNDIRLLNQKITNYHLENDELPILENTIEYADIIDVVTKEEAGDKVKINPNDSEEDYYIIDLEKLGGITLKYGRDYGKYKENSANIDEDKDVYIINKMSHTIYYLKGIKIELEGMNETKYSLENAYSEISLPSRVEYVKVTGTQYIDTEIVATSDVTAILEYEFSVSTNAYKVPFGVMKTNNNFAAGIRNDNYFTKRYGEKNTWVLSTVLASVNTRYNLKLNSTGLYINEELLLENTETTFDSGLNIYLGMINNNGNAVGGYSAGGMKIYSFKLYEAGKLVRDFIPYRTADNVIGFYDLVENKFYQNKGTEDFIAGKDIDF